MIRCIAALLLVLSLTTISEAQTRRKIRYCQGGRFKPCVCWPDVSKDVSYRPTYDACGGKAAILTRGRYLNVFSVVVRDRENRDRWPISGFNGCSYSLAQGKSPPNKCSAFKSQETLLEQTEAGPQRVFCLGAAGTSKLFARVTRMTAKIADNPNSSNDPLARWCLKSPKLPLN